MNRLFERLRKIRPGYLGKPVNVQKIILAQKELAQNRNAPLPEGFLEFYTVATAFPTTVQAFSALLPKGEFSSTLSRPTK